MKQTITHALGLVLVMTVLCGCAYTVLCTGLGQLLFPRQANGSVIEIDGKTYGSELLGQQFNDDSHMWGRIMNIDKCTDGRFLGVFGENTVNVLKFNLMLDGILEQ